MRAALAREWIDKHGRAVDQSRVAVELGEADPSTIVDAIRAYQNADGGFGRALEPDVRRSGSSVLATTIALQLLTRHGVDDAPDVLDPASAYLDAAYDTGTAAWPVVPQDVSDAPHAPWWNYRPPSDCLIIPRVEILGYAHRWAGFAGGADLDRIAAEVARHLADTDTVEMHELMMFNRLFGTPALPTVLEEQRGRFLELARQTIPVQSDDWKGYALMPLTIIDDPGHPLAGEFAEPIARNIDYLWSLQTEDGSWNSPWTWGGLHPDAWPQAERDIRSLITARFIGVLARFGAFH